jgi:hypothetical protein
MAMMANARAAGDATPAPATNRPAAPGIFELARRQAASHRVQNEVVRLFQTNDTAGAERTCREWLKTTPDDELTWYNLACALARQGRTSEAVDSLRKAVESGFRDVAHMRSDEDLASLQGEAAFEALIESAEQMERRPRAMPPATGTPLAVTNGVALVTDSNTGWDPRSGAFRVLFDFPAKPPTNRPVVVGHGAGGDLLRQWYEEGSAAGHYGDLYDNHDGGHSALNTGQFPQLSPVVFSPEARELDLHSGLQARILYNRPTIGNSSTATVGNPFWRSQTRWAMVSPHAMAVLYAQYASNQMYFYPEHNDYDPGHNGRGGFGDAYPANIPFVITSQGSSGSDKPFMDAVACTLAAFRPETKEFLVAHGALMPTVQMIFRLCNANVVSPEIYLTGRAHPPVFQSGNLDAAAMVRMAHDMTRDAVPPLARIRVIREDQAVRGRDFFAAAGTERIFDTPAAVARIYRSTQYERRMTVSAEESADLNGRPLRWQWVVLSGDEKRIRITPRNRSGSVVEIVMPWQERHPIEPGSRMESNRADIGLFVNNGRYDSAPAFVSFYFPDHEKRVYDGRHLIQSAEYSDAAGGGNYVDPTLDLPKRWRDEYHYDPRGVLIGWTRHRGDERQEFTADGALMLETDALGRPVAARTVVYVAVARENAAPLLEQRPGGEILRYSYSSARDRVGRIRSRENIAGAPAAGPADSGQALPAVRH